MAGSQCRRIDVLAAIPRSRTSSSANLSSEPNHKSRNYPMSPSRFLLAKLAVAGGTELVTSTRVAPSSWHCSSAPPGQTVMPLASDGEMKSIMLAR